MRNISRYPARPLTPDERGLVTEWLAAAGDIGTAYVSSRLSDDPVLFHRIVIVAKPGDAPSHLIHAASGRDVWIMFCKGARTKIRRFRTLDAALNSIRPVLVEASADTLRFDGRGVQFSVR
jgi:hypothetical protein